MENVLTQTILLQSRDCDFTGRWKPSEIFTAMQELAGDHAAILGAGYSVLRPANIAFALTRSELHMARYPKIGEKVICHTWPAPVMKWMFPRYFVFESESDEQLGYAATLWVLMDLTERKMVAPAALPSPIPTSDRKPPLRLPGKAAPLTGEGSARDYLPGYSELDVNGHVNNTRYVSWMCDELGADVLKDRCIRSIIVNYAHELLPGQMIALRSETEGTSFRMSGDVGGVNHFSLSGELAE